MAFVPIDPNKAEVRITGESPDYGLDFYIPKGERGEVGPTGPQGPAVPTNLSIGTIEVGPAAPGTVGPQGIQGVKGDPGGWVAGTSLGTADLNTITTDGIYRQNTGSNATLALNYPQAGVLGVLYVTQASTASWMMQEFHMNGTPNQARVFYVRVNAGGTWQPWRAYYSNRIDQTAGRAIYQWDDINGREQLTYGDTGWRSVRANINAEWDAATSNFDLRRVGNQVYISFDIYPAVANVTPSSGSAVYALPSGFGPAIGGSRNDYVGYCETAVSATPVPIVTRVNGGAIDVLLAGRAPANLKFIRGHFSWPTNAAWPTTLPGVANGTIPNV
jgi:hypothetical protein